MYVQGRSGRAYTQNRILEHQRADVEPTRMYRIYPIAGPSLDAVRWDPGRRVERCRSCFKELYRLLRESMGVSFGKERGLIMNCHGMVSGGSESRGMG